MLLTEIVGGGSAITTLDVSSGRTERLWQGGESIHDEGNFPNFSLDPRRQNRRRHSQRLAASARDLGRPLGDWKQLTHINSSLKSHWGDAKSISWSSDNFEAQGWLLYPRDYDASKTLSDGRLHSRRPRQPQRAALARRPFERRLLSALGYFVFFPNPRGSLRPGRGLHPRQREGLRLWRPARHHGRRRRRSENRARRSQPPRRHRLELRRLHDHVDRHPDQSLQGRGRRRRHRQLSELLRRKIPSTSG